MESTDNKMVIDDWTHWAMVAGLFFGAMVVGLFFGMGGNVFLIYILRKVSKTLGLATDLIRQMARGAN